jgi:hypothetical protein
MASRHKLRLKRNRRRERARAREATSAPQQPIAEQPVVVRLNGANIFKSLERRFDELVGPRSPEEALASVLVSK